MGWIFAGLSTAMLAQASAVTPSCQLHVWPGSKTGSVYHGWLTRAIVNGAVDGNPRYPKVPSDPMGTAEQAALLRAAQPQVLLGRSADILVIHPNALESRVIRSNPGRVFADGGGCYAELIVDDVMLRQDAANGSYLMVLFRYRDFADGALPVRSFATWVKSPIRRLPISGPFDIDAARADFKAAFTKDVKLFAEAASKPVKHR